jgi:nitroreductase
MTSGQEQLLSVLDLIQSRRSRGKMRADEPPRDLIEQVLAAAVHAPNHHDTQPWRFFVLTGRARNRLGDALADALAQRQNGQDPFDAAQDRPSKLEGLLMAERAKPMRSPVLVVVGVCSERDDAMTRREDLQAASAALQNMLLAAHSLGLAAIWRTGDGAYDSAVKAHFGLRPRDEIAGILYLGYPDPSLPAPEGRTRKFADKTEWRD